MQSLIVPFIKSADEDAKTKHTGKGVQIPGQVPRTSLVEYRDPATLQKLLRFDLPGNAKGKAGLLEAVEQLLKYSVNTWDQGFLDKLYASTNAVRSLYLNNKHELKKAGWCCFRAHFSCFKYQCENTCTLGKDVTERFRYTFFRSRLPCRLLKKLRRDDWRSCLDLQARMPEVYLLKVVVRQTPPPS